NVNECDGGRRHAWPALGANRPGGATAPSSILRLSFSLVFRVVFSVLLVSSPLLLLPRGGRSLRSTVALRQRPTTIVERRARAVREVECTARSRAPPCCCSRCSAPRRAPSGPRS